MSREPVAAVPSPDDNNNEPLVPPTPEAGPLNSVILPVAPLADVPLLRTMLPDVPAEPISPERRIAEPAGPMGDASEPSPVFNRTQPPATPALLVCPADRTTIPPTAELVEPTRTDRPPDLPDTAAPVNAPVLSMMLPLLPDTAVPDRIRILPDVLTELTPVVMEMGPETDPLAVGDTICNKPLEADVDAPVANVTHPEFPDAVVPVATSTPPVRVDPELKGAEPRITFPVLPSDTPDTARMSPPVLKAVVPPAVTDRKPPAPLLAIPTNILMDPDFTVPSPLRI